MLPQNLVRLESLTLVNHAEGETDFKAHRLSKLHRRIDSTSIDTGDETINQKFDTSAFRVAVNRASLWAVIPNRQSFVS